MSYQAVGDNEFMYIPAKKSDKKPEKMSEPFKLDQEFMYIPAKKNEKKPEKMPEVFKLDQEFMYIPAKRNDQKPEKKGSVFKVDRDFKFVPKDKNESRGQTYQRYDEPYAGRLTSATTYQQPQMVIMNGQSAGTDSAKAEATLSDKVEAKSSVAVSPMWNVFVEQPPNVPAVASATQWSGAVQPTTTSSTFTASELRYILKALNAVQAGAPTESKEEEKVIKVKDLLKALNITSPKKEAPKSIKVEDLLKALKIELPKKEEAKPLSPQFIVVQQPKEEPKSTPGQVFVVQDPAPKAENPASAPLLMTLQDVTTGIAAQDVQFVQVDGITPATTAALPAGVIQWNGSTASEIQKQNEAILNAQHRANIQAGRPLAPYKPAAGDQFYCREFNGSYTLRTANEIQEACHPGYWKLGSSGYPYFVREKKADKKKE